ncbi:hypothetical protein SDRG_16116, partial [Saprolegnia diclina VS20]
MQVRHMFDIETYMLTHPMETAASTYLGRHLPEVLVRKVAAYLVAPPVSLAKALRGSGSRAGYLPAAMWPHRNALSPARAASCVAVATRPRSCLSASIELVQGIDASTHLMSVLRANLDGDMTDDLGFGSLDSAFTAAFRYFYPHPRGNFGPDPDQITSAIATLLYDHGNVELIEAFLDVHNQWADDGDMAKWIVAVVRRFGGARFQHRLQTADITIEFAAHLVHLATTGDA